MNWAKNQSVNKARSTSKYCCVEFLPQTTIRKRSSNPRAGGPQRDLWKNHLTKKIWVWNSISSRPLFSQICWPFDNRRPLEQEKRKIVNNKNENSGRKISQCVASVFLSAVQWPFRQKISSAKNWVSNQIKSQDRNFPIWCKEPLFWLEAGLKISLFWRRKKFVKSLEENKALILGRQNQSSQAMLLSGLGVVLHEKKSSKHLRSTSYRIENVLAEVGS